MRMRVLVAAIVALCAVGCSPKVSFSPNRTTLYTQNELWSGFDAPRHAKGFDRQVYDEYIASGKFFPDAEISRLRGSHDEGMAEALREYVHDVQRNVVGIMGSGNPELRCKPVYEKTVRLTWMLAHEGKFLIATGGGPGQMEAANLGAYLADEPASSIDQALKILRTNLARDPKTGVLTSSDIQECNYNKTNGKDDEFVYTAAAQAVVA